MPMSLYTICYSMRRESAELDFSSVLFFPKSTQILQWEKQYVVLCEEQANWMVLYNERQKDIFCKLLEGNTIGSVYQNVGEGGIGDLKTVLAGIVARELASINNILPQTFRDASKMLNVYLTNSCNLHCVHCFMQSGKKMSNELILEDWKRILDEFAVEGGTNVTLTGGEPLMNPDFEDIVKHSHQCGLAVTVLSNGTMWSDEMIDRLSPYISEAQFSIDGINEESNAKVRGANNFEKVVNTVIRFAQNGVRTSVATTFTFENISSAEEYKDFVDRIKKKTGNAVFFKLTKKILQGRNVEYSESDNRRYFTAIKELEDHVDPNASYTNFIEGHEPNVLTGNCGYGGLSIASNGNAFYCNRIIELQSYGNVRQKSIHELIEIGRRLLHETSVDSVEPCRECELRYICGGDCRIDHFNFKGKLQGWNQTIRQVNCNQQFKKQLLKKMVDSYNFYYQFDGI